MTYFRRSLGAAPSGPITDPSQLENGETIGTVTPTRVDCSKLPADSPWRNPGQVCAPGILDWFLNLFKPSSPAPVTTDAHGCAPDQIWSDSAGHCLSPQEQAQAGAGMNDTTKLLLGGAVAVAAYYMFRKKKRP